MAHERSKLPPRIAADDLPRVERSQPRAPVSRDRGQSADKSVVCVVRIRRDDRRRRDQLRSVVSQQEQLTEPCDRGRPVLLAERSDDVRDGPIERRKVFGLKGSVEDALEHLPRVLARGSALRHCRVERLTVAELEFPAALVSRLHKLRRQLALRAPRVIGVSICQLQLEQVNAQTRSLFDRKRGELVCLGLLRHRTGARVTCRALS
jgi:hypothetical protein